MKVFHVLKNWITIQLCMLMLRETTEFTLSDKKQYLMSVLWEVFS